MASDRRNILPTGKHALGHVNELSPMGQDTQYIQPGVDISRTGDEVHRAALQFTDGPVRLVMAHDGTKNCIAVLLDKELVQTIQDLAPRQQEVFDKQRAFDKAEFDVRDIKVYGQQPEKLEGVRRRALEIETEQKDLERDIPKLFQAQQRCEVLRAGLLKPVHELKDLRNHVQRELVQAFDEAGLLDIKVTKTSVVPKNETRNGTRMSESEYSTSSSSHTCSSEGLTKKSYANETCRVESNREDRRYQAINELNRTREVLMEAQYRLDCRKQHYNEDLVSYQENGGEDFWKFTMTEFDNRQVEIGRILSRELIEAESAYDRAMSVVHDVHASSEAESSYYGEYFEPSLMGIGSEVLENAIRPRVEDWQASLVDSTNTENLEPVAVDQWDAESVDVSDSRSAIASDHYYRKRIDIWKDMQSTMRGKHGLAQENDKRDRKRRRS